MKIKNVTDPEFRRYGRIVDGYDFTEMIKVWSRHHFRRRLFMCHRITNWRRQNLQLI